MRVRSWNRLLLAAGLVAVVTASVHTFVGTPEIQKPLLESALSQPVRLLLFACWHLVTVALCLSSISLIWCAFLPNDGRPRSSLPAFISLLWLLFGLVFIVVALVFMGPPGLLVLPQWTLLTPVGVLGLIASLRTSADAEPVVQPE